MFLYEFYRRKERKEPRACKRLYESLGGCKAVQLARGGCWNNPEAPSAAAFV
jgi:hypothetical protein